MKPLVKCNCGQRVLAKDVMQTGYYLRLVGPSFVYVKFRCSRCKKLGEQFVKQEDWEDSILCEPQGELTSEERQRFDCLGKVGVHECIDAHFQLERMGSMGELLEALEETGQ